MNHLAYGKDGYGLLLSGSRTPDLALVALQREIDFGRRPIPPPASGSHRRRTVARSPPHGLVAYTFRNTCFLYSA